MVKQVLLVLEMMPGGNYEGPKMVDYQVVSLNTADIIKAYLEKYSNTNISFYSGKDYDLAISDAGIELTIFKDKEIIKAYKLLEENNLCVSSYYIYDIIRTALVNHDHPTGDDCDEDYINKPTEEEIMAAAINLGLIEYP